MEGNKLDLTGKKEEKQPLASYKAIPEADMEDDAVTSPNKAVIKVSNYTGKDGADEKMLSDDESKFTSNNVDIPEDKVIIKEKNGDAKLDIGDIKSAFAGMGKEELMKYANDPFWVKIRWLLFIVFWLLWLGMLLGAVSIIYTAPKCDPPQPRKWWEQGPLAEIKQDTKLEKLTEMKSSGVKGFILEWPEDSYSEIDDNNVILSLLQKSKEANISIILDLEASMSNVWFENSEKKAGFEDYYIWRTSDKLNASGVQQPPNNWISRKNESSWKYSPFRKEFYYAPEGWPQLNFRNENVVQEFVKVLKKFAEKGAKGFRIRDAHLLLVDTHFEDQIPDNSKEVKEKGVFLTDYGFYVHTKTEHLLELGPLLKKFRQVVKNVTNDGPFMVKTVVDKIEAYKVNGSLVVDLPSQSHLLNKPVFEPERMVHNLEHVFKIQRLNWPLWGHKMATLPADVLDSITYLMPGVPVMDGGAEINKELEAIRATPPIMRGDIEYKAVANKTVLAFTRRAPGSPGILVAVNPSDITVVVDFPKYLDKISDEVTIQFLSKNFNESNYVIGLKKEANNVSMSPKSSIVLAYTLKDADK